MFTANDARIIVNKQQANNLNYQRIYILDMIKITSKTGKDFIVINEPRIRLFEDDYVFFENLGYNVTRDTKEIRKDKDGKEWQYHKFAVISW